MIKRHIGFGLNVGALALFFPGILLPMFALNMELAATLSSSSLTTPLINKELSILATIQDLWTDQRALVAALIFLFSVCIPLAKTSLITIAYFKKNTHLEHRILGFVSSIGKWSMADVFVVAVFLAFLSTTHAETANSHQLTLFGFNLGIEISTETLSSVGLGFYCFTAYCLVSLVATHLALSSVGKKK